MSTFYIKLNNLFSKVSFRWLGCVMVFGLLLFGNTHEASASHVVGSDITYKCMNTQGFFEVTLVVYRKCDGGSATLCGGGCGSPCPQQMQIQGADPSCVGSTFGTINLALVSVRDVNIDISCPLAKNSCNNMGCVSAGTYTPAVERYEFKGVANIGSTSGIPSTCCNVRFTWSLCCRNSNITTGAADANFYVDAIVNRCLSTSPCNSSPELTNDPYAIICGGENYVFNNGAVDPDLDSLSYSFTPALTGFGASVPYLSPYAWDRPMPWIGNVNGVFPAGIHCDPLNGDIMFTPTYSNPSQFFIGVMAVEIKQWKLVNGVMTVIGITRRDIQMVLRGDCLPNNPPRLMTNPPDDENPNQPKYNWSVCAGDQLCFTVTAKDTDFIPPSIIDTTYLSWNASLAAFGATFKPAYDPLKRKLPDSLGGGPREDIYRFCWTPDDSKASTTPYYFTVTGKDKRCPNPGRVTRAFSVLVVGKANLQVVKKNLRCGKWAFSYTNLTPKLVPSFTQWQISRVPGDEAMSQNPYTFINRVNTDTIQFRQGGRYYILLKAITPGPIGSPGCERYIKDSFDVDTVMLVQKRDTLVCAGKTVQLSASPLHGTPSYSYRWYNSITDTSTNPLNSNLSSSTFTVSTPVTRYYTIQIRDINQCRAYDSVRVEAKSLPTGSLPVSTRICIEDTFVLDPGNNGGNIKKFLWNVGDTTQTIAKRDSGLYIVTITDTFNCEQTDSMMLYVNRRVDADLGPDKAICEGSSVMLQATGGHMYQWRNLNTGAIILAKGYADTLKVNPTNTSLPTRYELKAYLSYPDSAARDKECANTDTIVVTVNALPKLKRPTASGACFTESTVFLPNFPLDNTQFPGQGGTGSFGSWSYPQDPSALTAGGTQVIISKLKNIPTKDTVLWYDNWVRYTFTGRPDVGGCSTTDSAIIRIYGTPPTNAGPDITRCDNAGDYQITTVHPYGPQNPLHALEFWSGPGVDSSLLGGVKYFTFKISKPGVQRFPAKNLLTYLYGKDYAEDDPGVGKACYKSDQMFITVTTAPVITATQDIVVCQDDPMFAIKDKTNDTIIPSVGTSPYWEAADVQLKDKGVLNGQTFSPAGAANALPIGLTNANRSYVMYYKDTSTGCAVQASIKISIARTPRVDLAYDNLTADSPYVCLNTKSVLFRMSSTRANSATLNETQPSMNNIVYSVTPTSGAAAFGAGNPGEHLFNSNAVTPGTYWLKTRYTNNQGAGGLSASFPGCSSSDSTRIVVQDPPKIGVAIPPPLCSYDSAVAVSLSLTPVAGYGFKWVVAGDGTYANELVNPGSYRPGPNDKLAGMVTIKAQSTKDITLQGNKDQCAVVDSSQVLNIYPAPTAVIIPIDSEGCVPYTGRFAAGPTGVANADFNWSWNDIADPTKDSLITRYVEDFETEVKGKYKLGLTVNATYGPTVCSATAIPAMLVTHALPVASFTSNPKFTTIAKPFFNFIDQSSVAEKTKLNYMWNLGPGPDPKKPGDRIVTVANPSNVEYAPDTAWQKVYLKVTTEFGCTDSIVDSVRIEPDITVFIPNAFRPVSKDGTVNSTAPCIDGDPNCNSVFRIVADGHVSIEVFIYNRWGQLVYSSKEPSPAWNGRVDNTGEFCPQDVYVYQVNATSFNGKAYKYSGSVTLLR